MQLQDCELAARRDARTVACGYQRARVCLHTARRIADSGAVHYVDGRQPPKKVVVLCLTRCHRGRVEVNERRAVKYLLHHNLQVGHSLVRGDTRRGRRQARARRRWRRRWREGRRRRFRGRGRRGRGRLLRRVDNRRLLRLRRRARWRRRRWRRSRHRRGARRQERRGRLRQRRGRRRRRERRTRRRRLLRFKGRHEPKHNRDCQQHARAARCEYTGCARDALIPFAQGLWLYYEATRLLRSGFRRQVAEQPCPLLLDFGWVERAVPYCDVPERLGAAGGRHHTPP